MIKFEPYKAGDEAEILKLFANVFGTVAANERPESVWRWQYLDNPVESTRILLAWQDNSLVGHYAVSPRHLVFQQNVVPGALSLDTMVDSSCQGQGLFKKLASGLYDRLQGDGFACVFGFPNGNSVEGFKRKLEWSLDGQAVVMVAPTLTFPKYTSSGLTFAASTDANLIAWREVAGIASSMLAPYECYVSREPSYLRWRYEKVNDREYMFFSVRQNRCLVGFTVIRIAKVKGISSAFVMDCFFDQQTVGREMMKAVRWELLKKGIFAVLVLAHPRDHEMELKFRKFGFWKVPKRAYTSPLYFGVRDLQENDKCSNKRWFLSWSDTDLL